MNHKPILVLGLIACLSGGGVSYWRLRTPEVRPLVLSGNVDIREVNLAFRVSGRVAEMMVDEGDSVKAGDTIAQIDPEPLKTALAQAQGALVAAQAAWALLKAGPREEEISRLKAQMEGAQAAATNARLTFERQKALVTSSTVSRQALDNAQAALDQANAGYESARQAYLTAEHGARPEDLAQARAQSQSAEARRDAARLQLEDTILHAPSDGTVLTRAVEPGTMVNAGSSIVTLSLDRPVRVRAYVQQPDLGRVAPGAKVLVYTDARPGKPYSGTVGFVSPRAEFTPKQVETQDLRTALVYRIRIVVDADDTGLRQGMPVTVRLADETQ